VKTGTGINHPWNRAQNYSLNFVLNYVKAADGWAVWFRTKFKR
jgi:hypothetical protein